MAADHHPDQIPAVDIRDSGAADVAAVTEHLYPVADRGDLLEAMADVDDPCPFPLQLPDDLMEGRHLRRRQRGAGLIHDEDPGACCERLGDLDELLPGHREGTTRGIGVEIGPQSGKEGLGAAALGATIDQRQPGRAAGELLAKEDVVGRAEGGNEIELLVDHSDARAAGVLGRPDRPLDAVDEDPSSVGADGTAYHINSDLAAGQIARTLAAEKLILMTNVPGVFDGDGKLVYVLSASEAEKLLDDGTVQGGMRPRLMAALAAVREGVRSVHIIDGSVPSALLLEVLTNSGVGTALRSDDAPDFLAAARSYFAADAP